MFTRKTNIQIKGIYMVGQSSARQQDKEDLFRGSNGTNMKSIDN